jgi:hypothetical protein
MAWEHLPLKGGRVKSLMLLWNEVSHEMGNWCQTSTVRDFKTVEDRVKHEGISFLTISLPQFCKDFEKGLEQSSVDSTMFLGFKRRGGLPVFLQGFLSRVFSSDGRLLENPCVDSIQAVRQLTLLFSKIELPCSPARVASAYAKFLECEQDVRRSDKLLPQDLLLRFRRIGRLLLGQLFSQIDLAVYEGKLVPRHGPGATADRLMANQKYSQTEWTQRLENLFPSAEYLFPSHSYWREAQRVDILEPGAERPVRVITVPKTLKTPRIIAIEPTAMQYMQQALLELIVEGVQRDPMLYSFLGFDDQYSNQRMAQKGSSDGSLATIDLSEASDRVSNQHVRALTGDHKWLSSAIDATRSRKADVLGKVIRLAKFASMGSALCFPFEAFTFLVCCFIGIEDELNRRLSRRDLRDHVGKVRVYGDDIIVPTHTVSSVVRVLETFGFKINRNKSFWNGKFRESCGMEYYAGHDVTTVRVRQLLPERRTDSKELISTAALRNNLFSHGMWQSARYLDDLLDKYLTLPAVSPTSPSLGRHSFLGYDTEKMDAQLHSPLVKGYAVVPRLPKSPLDGLGALLKFFLKRGVDPHQEGHLLRSGRPVAVDIKRRWIRPF